VHKLSDEHNNHQSAEAKPSNKIGGVMFVFAWVAAGALLVAIFSGVLERKENPNQRPNSVVTDSGVEVVLKQNRMGHYVTNGEINGQKVTFLLDTGATNVSVGAHLGAQLGLVPGQRFTALTANGSVTVAQTNIASLKIGEIYLENVQASLNPGMKSDQILLGMSVLKQLEWTQRGDVLTLRTF
jgi:aspartyl protease family protein